MAYSAIWLQKGGAESAERCNGAKQAQVQRPEAQKHLWAGMATAHGAAIAGLCSIFMLSTDLSAGVYFQKDSCHAGDDGNWDEVRPLNSHPQTSLCGFSWGYDG